MTVKKLIERLQALPQDSIVILQKDVEGNGYSPLSMIDHNAVYKADNAWSGDVFSTKWTAGAARMAGEEWVIFKKETPACVVLVPAN